MLDEFGFDRFGVDDIYHVDQSQGASHVKQLLRPTLDPEQVTLDGASSHTPEEYDEYGFIKSDFNSPKHRKASVVQQKKESQLTDQKEQRRQTI